MVVGIIPSMKTEMVHKIILGTRNNGGGALKTELLSKIAEPNYGYITNFEE